MSVTRSCLPNEYVRITLTYIVDTFSGNYLRNVHDLKIQHVPNLILIYQWTTDSRFQCLGATKLKVIVGS